MLLIKNILNLYREYSVLTLGLLRAASVFLLAFFIRSLIMVSQGYDESETVGLGSLYFQFTLHMVARVFFQKD